MPENKFNQEEVDAIKAHVQRTREEASGGLKTAKSVQTPTVVIGQFNEPVYTPVEEHLEGADPQSVPGVVDDYRDVAALKTGEDDGLIASEAVKQGIARQAQANENPVKPQPPEDGSFSLNDHINHPLPEQPMSDEVNMKGFRQDGEPPLPDNVAHEELYPRDVTDATVSKKKK